MHTSLIKPGDNSLRINNEVFYDIENLMYYLLSNLKETGQLLFQNKIWKWRTKKVGIINYYKLHKNSLSGVLLRWSGGYLDHHIFNNYCNYNIKNVFVPKSINSDIYDRVNLRIEELYSSIKIIQITLKWLQLNKILNKDYNFFSNKNIMENVIKHFKINTENINTFEKKKIYHAIESPKGEFGVLLVGNKNQNKLMRTKIRTPGFFHLQVLSDISKNKIITDCLSILGSFDIVLGEIDK